MSIYIDSQARKNCWNLRDSYGEICVHCGCCANDKRERYKNRIECLNRWIKDEEAFNLWDDAPAIRELQERNVENNIRSYKIQIARYEWELEQLEADKNDNGRDNQEAPLSSRRGGKRGGNESTANGGHRPSGGA